MIAAIRREAETPLGRWSLVESAASEIRVSLRAEGGALRRLSSEAIQGLHAWLWIASSQVLLAMTGARLGPVIGVSCKPALAARRICLGGAQRKAAAQAPGLCNSAYPHPISPDGWWMPGLRFMLGGCAADRRADGDGVSPWGTLNADAG